MQFTPLETTLITIVGSVIVGIVIRSRSVGKAECKEHRDAFGTNCQHLHSEADANLKEQLGRINTKLNTIFRMNRAMAVHMDIPEDQKVKILNEKGDEG